MLSRKSVANILMRYQTLPSASRAEEVPQLQPIIFTTELPRLSSSCDFTAVIVVTVKSVGVQHLQDLVRPSEGERHS